ncbi:MAG: acetyl-CoA hydrolase/transferase C-terminal domain-containing protein [Acidimicrobiales bacterium]
MSTRCSVCWPADGGSHAAVGTAAATGAVTEYGVADMRGRSISQRAAALIGVAHPRFRDGLTEARTLHYL